MATSSEFKEITHHGVLFVSDDNIYVNVLENDNRFRIKLASRHAKDDPARNSHIISRFFNDVGLFGTSGGLVCSVIYSATLATPIGNLCTVETTNEYLDEQAYYTLRIIGMDLILPNEPNELDESNEHFPYRY